MRIGHYQAACIPGNFKANLAKVEAGLERARREQVAILCFRGGLHLLRCLRDGAGYHLGAGAFALECARIRRADDRSGHEHQAAGVVTAPGTTYTAVQKYRNEPARSMP